MGVERSGRLVAWVPRLVCHVHTPLLHDQTQDYCPGHNGPSDGGLSLQTFHSASLGVEFHPQPLHHIRTTTSIGYAPPTSLLP